MNPRMAWADEPTGESADATVVVEVAGALRPNFVEFYRDERVSITRAVALSIGDTALAAEAVDEAMTRAYARWNHVQLDNPAGWVFRVALNWSRTMLQRRIRPPRVPGDLGTVAEPAVGEPAVLAALRELPLEQRAVVVCRHLLGWSEAETATALGIRRGTVKSRLSRALHSLQVTLTHLAPEAPR